MLRQSLIYLLLSILIVVFARYAHILIVYITMFFTYLNFKLTPVFSTTGWGPMIRKILILMFIPLVITSIPALGYRVIKGKDMPHFLPTLWVIWTIIVLSIILIR